MHRKLLLAAAVAALASAAAAQPHGESRQRLFISPAGEPFRQGDGLAVWFAGADADHDGALTPAEMRADFQRFFQALDTDGNGELSGFELQAYERDRAPEIAHLGFDMEGPPGGGNGGGHGGGRPKTGFKRGGDGGATPRQGAARYSLLNIAQPVTNADEDVNGKVSAAEWTRASARRFGMLDKTGTGRLTMDTLRPAPAEAKRQKAADLLR